MEGQYSWPQAHGASIRAPYCLLSRHGHVSYNSLIIYMYIKVTKNIKMLGSGLYGPGSPSAL